MTVAFVTGIPIKEKYIRKTKGQFNSIVTNMRIGFFDKSTENIVLKAGEGGGEGIFERIIADKNFITDLSYEEYLIGGIL